MKRTGLTGTDLRRISFSCEGFKETDFSTRSQTNLLLHETNHNQYDSSSHYGMTQFTIGCTSWFLEMTGLADEWDSLSCVAQILLFFFELLFIDLSLAYLFFRISRGGFLSERSGRGYLFERRSQRQNMTAMIKANPEEPIMTIQSHPIGCAHPHIIPDPCHKTLPGTKQNDERSLRSCYLLRLTISNSVFAWTLSVVSKFSPHHHHIAVLPVVVIKSDQCALPSNFELTSFGTL